MKVFKVREEYYSKSLQTEHISYKDFPQREAWMIPQFRELELSDLKNCDAVWIDNPMFFNGSLLNTEKPVIFDAIDWYLEMAIKEGRFESIKKITRGFNLLRKYKNLFLISQSPLIEQYLLNVVGLKPLVKKIIPNGYDYLLHNFKPFYVPHIPLTNLFFAGKLGRWYSNLSYFIEYVKHHPRWNLVIAGDGELKTYFESIAEKSPNIKFLGFISREDVAKQIKDSDICIFPVDDCSPIVVSEYMACGKPVINIGKRLEWLVTLDEGMCIPSPGEIETALKYCTEEYSSLRINARKKIEPYSWEKNAIQFEEGVKELLEKC